MSSLGIAAGLSSAPDLRSAPPGQATPSGRDGAFGAVLDLVAGSDDPPPDPAGSAPPRPGGAAIPPILAVTVQGLAARATAVGDDAGRNAASRTPIDVTAWAAALANGATGAAVDQAAKGGTRTGLPAAKPASPKAPDEAAATAEVPAALQAPTPTTPEPALAATTSAGPDHGREGVQVVRTGPAVPGDAHEAPGPADVLAAATSPSLDGLAAAPAPVPAGTTAAVVTPAAIDVAGRPTSSLGSTSVPPGVQASAPALVSGTAPIPGVTPGATQAPAAGMSSIPKQGGGPAPDQVKPVPAAAVRDGGSDTAAPVATTAARPLRSMADPPAPANGSQVKAVTRTPPHEAGGTPALGPAAWPDPSANTAGTEGDDAGKRPVPARPDAGPAASPPGRDAGSPQAPAPASDQTTAGLAIGRGQAAPAAIVQATPGVTAAARPGAAPMAAGVPAAGRSGGAGAVPATAPTRPRPVAASAAAGVSGALDAAVPAVAPAAAGQPDVPAAAPSAAGQVATVLQDLGRTAEASGPPAGGAAVASPDAAPGGAPPGRALSNREVTIQLNPENLGTVQVRMRMRADTIDIQIEVANPQTLHLLEKDRHLLSAAVEGLGAGPKALALSGPEPAATAAARAGPDDPFTSAGSSGGDGRPASQRATPATRSDPTRDTSDVPSDTRPDRTDSSLYL